MIQHSPTPMRCSCSYGRGTLLVLIEYTDIWARIHELLPEYGFILRYLEGKESITGYGYEPWHIRYVGSPETAKDIAGQGLTLEEYLGRLPLTDVTPPED